eukprot:TRINITY_DN51871_c0_g1_i3.p1 TRINITY_DN51871_c0_g1~~TRINITY_DN51871_c0_g1_i3.p1  ORF type:complete len:128 (+),score=24.17 TRINITY_DN51871_c0_g1_i3:214-597(+)
MTWTRRLSLVVGKSGDNPPEGRKKKTHQPKFPSMTLPINFGNWSQRLSTQLSSPISTAAPTPKAQTPPAAKEQLSLEELEKCFVGKKKITLSGNPDRVLLKEGELKREIGRAVQQECRDRSRMPSSA